MSTRTLDLDALEALGSSPESDIVEVPLLLPGWQVAALETAAHDRGLTAGEMVRTLLRDFLNEQTPRPTRLPRRL
jgi:hypothetical protein